MRSVEQIRLRPWACQTGGNRLFHAAMKIHPGSLERLEDRVAPATLVVTTLKDTTDPANDTGSLRDAILEANATAGADTIIFQTTVHAMTVPLHGTIKLTSDLPIISDSLTINGPVPGKASSLVLNGNKHSVIFINSGDLNLNDLTITHGQTSYGGGGVYITGGTSALHDVTISGNRAISTDSSTPGTGGGILIASGTVTITDSKITGNVAKGFAGDSTHAASSGYAGGIFSQGTLVVQNSVISGNIAQGGNAKLHSDKPNGGGAYGGGIYCSRSNGNVTVQNSIVTGNKVLGGSGVAGPKGTEATANYPGTDGYAGGKGGIANGGGIYAYKGTTVVMGSTISGNMAKAGKSGPGGKGSTGKDGGPGGDGGESHGGGLSSSGGYTTVLNSTISGNTTLATKASAGGAPGIHGGMHGASGDSGLGEGGGIYSAGRSRFPA